jgi:hypothetical protein
MWLLLAFVCLALALSPPASAKDIQSIVVVGSDGRSTTIGAEQEVLGVMLYHPASVYNVRPHQATPRGGFVKIYPVGPGGFPAIPGRFYPATRALCSGWNQAIAPSSCGRLAPPRHLLAVSRWLAHFVSQPTVLVGLDPSATANLLAAVQLALDRFRLARAVRRPASCLSFFASWRGREATRRATDICIAHRGVYARGRLYPAGPAIWRLARDARRVAR